MDREIQMNRQRKKGRQIREINRERQIEYIKIDRQIDRETQIDRKIDGQINDMVQINERMFDGVLNYRKPSFKVNCKLQNSHFLTHFRNSRLESRNQKIKKSLKHPLKSTG